MKRIFWALGLLIGIAVTGCSQDHEPVADTAVSTTPSPTDTVPPTETAVPTKTSTVPSTKTAVPTQTNTPSLEMSATPTVVLATSTATPHIPLATASDDGIVSLNEVVLLDIQAEEIPCYYDIPAEIIYAPTYEHFLVIPACIEGDNELYLFRADGTGKQRITSTWDLLNFQNVAWSPDGKSFTYERLNSCCLSQEEIPADAPPVGLVQVDVITEEKVLIATPTPRP